MKRRIVAEPQKTAKQIHAEVVAETLETLGPSHDPRRVATALPALCSATPSLYRARAKVRPPLPKTRADIILEGPWIETKDGRPFLVIDDGSEQRILGFTTDDLMTTLCGATTVYMDGTFRAGVHNTRSLVVPPGRPDVSVDPNQGKRSVVYRLFGHVKQNTSGRSRSQ